MPNVDKPLLQREVHFQVRWRHPTTRRLGFQHFPARDFDIDRFDARYEIARGFNNYRERKNRIGRVWLSTTGRSVQYESALERMVLLQLDQDPNVIGIWTQPFRLEGLDPQRGNKPVRLYPDILTQRIIAPNQMTYNGQEVRFYPPTDWKRNTQGRMDERTIMEVVEVKPRRRMIEPVQPQTADHEELRRFGARHTRWRTLTANFAWEAAVFNNLAWSFRVAHEPAKQLAENIRYIQIYRRPLAKEDPVSKAVLSNAATSGTTTIGELAEAAGGHTVATPVILHHVWHNNLLIDWNQPLSSSTTLTSAIARSIAVAA